MNDIFDLFLNRLPDSYYKELDGNVAKVMQLITEDIQDNVSAYQQMIDYTHIDNAAGVILDMIGADAQQRRGNLDDNIYRYLIRAKIKRTQATGTCDNIIEFIAFILQMDISDVVLTETWETGKTMNLSVTVPANEIAKTGLSVKQFGTLLDLIAIGGVRVMSLFEGTFEFGDIDEPIDNEKGFGDEAETVGGQLGYAYDPETDFDLPL